MRNPGNYADIWHKVPVVFFDYLTGLKALHCVHVQRSITIQDGRSRDGHRLVLRDEQPPTVGPCPHQRQILDDITTVLMDLQLVVLLSHFVGRIPAIPTRCL